MRITLLFTVLCAVASGLSSCRKEARITGSATLEPVPVTPGAPHAITFRFEAYCNGELVVPFSKKYYNLHSDSFTVNLFSYYISHIRLHNANGTVFAEPESYHLIKHVDNLTTITFTGVPAGTYTAVTFMLGVDSLKNVSGVQSGALDPAHNMFWDWDTGYIFYKLEGDYISQLGSGQYAVHVGGFSGDENCIRETTLTFTTQAVSAPGTTTHVDIRSDAGMVFDGPSMIGIDDYFAQLPRGPRIFQQIADNYRHMFTVVKVENRSN